MKVAITVWNQRISPVLDAARTLLIAEIDQGQVVAASQTGCDCSQPQQLLRLLRSQGVATLICGAVSEEWARQLTEAEVRLLGFIAGDVEEVVRAFAAGEPLGERFPMPGCGKSICCRGKIRRGRQLGGIHGAWRRQDK